METDSEETVRSAFEAFLRGDLPALRELVDADLEWTYLDPTMEDPIPATCRGRRELEKAAGQWSSMGLVTQLEELASIDDKVAVIMYAPGLDRFRARSADDRNFHLVTVRDGKVVSMRACRDRAELRARAGLQ